MGLLLGKWSVATYETGLFGTKKSKMISVFLQGIY